MNISNKKKRQTDDSSFEKIGEKIKVKTYSLIYELIQANVTTQLLYKLLILIETAQCLWYMTHPRYEFLWRTEIATGMRQAIKYLQFDYIITQGNSTTFLVCLYAVLAIEVIIGLLIYYIIRSLNSPTKKTSTLLTYAIKIVSLFAFLLTTVLTIPFFHIFVAAFYCNKNDPVHGDMECYKGLYLVHFAVAVLGFLIYLAYLLMFLPFYIDLNPWAKVPYASPKSLVPFAKLVFKLIAPAYITIDFKGNLNVQFVVVAAVFWLAALFLRYQASPYYDRSVNRFVLICESTLLWAGGVANIHAFLDKNSPDNIGLLFLIIAAPFIATTYVSFVERRYMDIIKEDIKVFKEDDDMEIFMTVLIDLVENKHEPMKKVQLEGVLKYYTMQSGKNDITSAGMKLIKSNLKEESPEKDLLWYEWLRDILLEGIEKFDKSPKLHLINAYLHQEKLNNRFKALYELLISDENKPEIQEEFSIFRYKNIIEEEIIESDINSSENKGIDVNILVHFQNKFVEFQTLIEKSVSFHLDFWRELLEDNPDIQKLQSLSSKITNSVEQVGENFIKISEINNNHTKMLRIYGNFLMNIVNDDLEAKKLLEKAEYIEKTSTANKQFIDNERLKYGENSNTCIVTLSGNYNTLGTVTNINNEITRILEYAKGDMMGQNVNRIMPKIIADGHDAMMRRYFETSEPIVMGLERVVFPTNKSGYLVPCSLMIKVLPTLDEGIRVVGFLKDLDNEASAKADGLESDENVHYIMYGGENNTVYGISSSCYTTFGIPSSLVYGNASSNELTIDTILPSLLTYELDELKNPNGFLTTLDSTTLQQNYYMGENTSEVDDEDEDEQPDVMTTAKYKKTTIRAVLIQDQDYKDIPKLRVLKFVEAVEGEDNFAAIKKILPDIRDKPQEEVNQEDIVANNDVSRSQVSVTHDDIQLNEKMKQLKDAKTLISEKNVPRSIKFLKRVGIFMSLGILVVACINLSMSFFLRDEVSEGVYGTLKAYERYDVMSSINYQLRKLELLSRRIIAGNTTNTALLEVIALPTRNTLVSLIDKMQELQFEVIKADIKMQKRSSNAPQEGAVTIESLLSKKVKYDTSNLTDALFTFLSQASSVRNASLLSFTQTSDVDTTRKNFFFVRRNGLGSLRASSEAFAEAFYAFYAEQTDNYYVAFLVLAVVTAAIVVVTNFASLPIVSSLHHTNKKVLSMFGYIPTDDINNLAVKCEKFIRDHLEDRGERRDFSFESDDNSQSNLKKDEEEEAANQREEDRLIDGEENLDDSVRNDNRMKSPVSRRMTLNGSVSAANITKNSAVLNNSAALNNSPNINAKVDNNQNAEDLEEQEKVEAIHYSRSQKLLNSRKNQNKSDIVKFMFFSIIYIGGAVIYFVVQNMQISNNQKAFEHLKLISQGIPQIRYINVYTLEELAENDVNSVYQYEINEVPQYFDARRFFLKATQDNERDIANSEKRDFPGDFDDYKTLFKNLNYGDLCSEYYIDLPTAEATCKEILDGLLRQGLKVGVKTITSNSLDIMNQFYSTDRSNITQASFISSGKFTSSEAIQEQVTPALQTLLEVYKEDFEDYIDYALNSARIWFTCMILFLLFTFFLLWLPYMKRLRDDIWRTKGMLNMIPMEIISENENLSDLFISGELTKAVQ